MADKAIPDLTQATQITGEDLFVLQQNGEAKKLKGSQVVQYAKDSVAAEVQGVKEYADSAKASADAAAKDATRAETAAQGIDDKVSAADASAKAAASSAAAAAASATGVDEKVQAAQTAADNAAQSETAAKAAQTAAANAQKAAESAQTRAQAAQTAAESAQEAAEIAKDAAAGSSTAAGQKATQAAQSAEDAASAKSAAETAKTDAQAARDSIVNMIVEAITLASGSDATVSKSVVDNVFKLAFGIPRGNPGADAPTITGITIRQSDYHMIVSLSDGTTYDAGYCRGAAGAGSGDMLAAVYDPQGKQLDIYKYVDDAFSNVPANNVKFSDGTTFQQKLDSGALKGDHGEKGEPGEKGADGAPGKDGAKGADGTPGKDGADGKTPVKGVDYFTAAEVAQIAQEAAGKVDSSDAKVTFTVASTRTALESGTKLAILMGKIAKWFNDLGWLAFKDTVTTNDVSAGIKASLSRADSALQSVSKNDATATVGQLLTKTADGQEWKDREKDVFVVNMTTSNGNTIEPADKTFEEIQAAYIAGKTVIARLYFGPLSKSFDCRMTNFARDSIITFENSSGSQSFEITVEPEKIALRWFTAQSQINATGILKGNGSGGVSAATAGTDYALKPTTRKVTLTASGWNSSTKQQTVTCSGVLSDATQQLLIPTSVNTAAGNPYDEASIQMVAQGANSVTFYADTVPTESIDVYVTIYPINYLG